MKALTFLKVNYLPIIASTILAVAIVIAVVQIANGNYHAHAFGY
jgi:hypothetical protein